MPMPLLGQKKGSILIKNATVLTITNGTLVETDVLVMDGIITKIGKGIASPKDVPAIDASGRYLMPGIIDAHSHVALDVINESTSPVTAEVRMADVVDPFDIGLYRALAGGVTISNAMHGSANVIGGVNVTLKHRYGTHDPETLIMREAPKTIKFALGENPTRVHGVFSHVNEGFKVAPELAKYTMGASVFSDWWAYKFEVYYSTAYNAAILARNGVVTSINSDSAELIRHLYHEAGKTQRYGSLSDEEALALITINPARQLGIADKVGSIEVGKQADLVIFENHPLSIYAIPQMTFVDGIKYFDLHEDKSDQRLKVSATEMVEPVILDQQDHRCMHGVELFSGSGESFGTH